MQILSLNEAWQLYRANQPEPIPATVPGCVHTDLLAAGLIPDPYYRANEQELQWIGETDWSYRRTFTVSEELLAHQRVLLRCHGLDTLATINLNGQRVAQTDNMFRTWEFDVKNLLQPGDNRLEITFASAVRYGQGKLKERFLPNWGTDSHKIAGGNWLRKSQCNFGWDWGPKLVTCGIWRDIELVAFDTARISDLLILQDHSRSEQVTLTFRVAVECISHASVTTKIVVSLGDQVAAAGQLTANYSEVELQLTIAKPELWWPNGMGRQTLYDVTTTLLDETGATLDSDSRQIGLRTLHLEREPDEWGESFQFVANDVPFFAKGANWIPADTFIPRLSGAHYSRLLQAAAAANMNMVRVWGGGIYEQDIFYELCDRLGLCVWQDFMFACAAYPTFDEAYLATVQVEIEDNVRRLRHRPSLALWCGNNELEQRLVGEAWTDTTMSWADYSRLFDQLLPNMLARLDPQRDYWPASPHTPLGDRHDFNNPTCGDAHIWNVWHGLEPFEFYRGCEHRFNSEFGFQSFPEPATVYSYTTPPDHNITSPVMEHHQRSGIGNVTIIQYLLSWFRMPTSFEHTLWLSQIQQGMAIKYAVEHWRRTMPRGMGTLYWQLNDCWPVASWSSLDSFGRWKALHYMARHFYAPLLLSGVEDLNAGAVDIYLTSDLLADTTGRVYWWLTTVAGDQVDNGQLQVDIPARQNRLVTRLDLKSALAQYGPRNLLLWLELTVAGETVSSNLILLARPKQLELEPPQLSAAIEQIGPGQFTVQLSARKPALWAWLELPEIEARYADNFFHLRPNLPQTITVTTTADLSPEQLKGSLRLQSLINTY